MLSKASTGRTLNKPITSKTTKKPANVSSSNKISSRLDAKVVHPLGQDTHRTAFAAVYARGGIPCRLVHGSVFTNSFNQEKVKHKIAWSKEPFQLDYNPLLITFFEGLKETQHPYVLIVKLGLNELLDAPGSAEKLIPVLKSISLPLRAGLCSKNTDTFITALDAVKKIAQLVGDHLIPHLGLLLPPISSRVISNDSKLRDLIYETLAICEAECGEDALKLIRSRVPTYNSMNSLK